MELLDRYLSAVRMHLPKEQADDIVEELSENLRSQIEDREAELHRPLTAPEIEALLREHGPPMVVAGRYRNEERSFVFGRKKLIGPELFPRYIKTFTINAILTSIAAILAQIIFDAHWNVGSILTGVGFALAVQFVIVTLVFIAAERYLSQHPDLWLRRKAVAQRPHGPRPESRLNALFELAVIIVVVMWWLSLPRYVLPIFQSTPIFESGSSWASFYLWMLGLTMAQVIPSSVMVVRPQWLRFRAASGMLIHGATAVVTFYYAKVGVWVLPAGNMAEHVRAAEALNRAINIGLMAFALISAYLCALNLWHWMRLRANVAPVAQSNGPAEAKS